MPKRHKLQHGQSGIGIFRRQSRPLYKILSILMLISFLGSTPSHRRTVPRELLAISWAAYKTKFIQEDGRTIEWRRDQITTSEGQAYAMLRSVWMDDRETFDRARVWANNNLRVRGDALYAWKWGKGADGVWGPLDKSTASDADEDIAYALIIAARRWRVPDYEVEARSLLGDLWKLEVAESPFGPILAAGDWAPHQTNVTVNPSYLAPYAYRLFARIDPERPWSRMVDASYKLLDQAADLSPVGLTPDWCVIDHETGQVLAAESFPDGSGHSYDAWRVAWRIAFDARVVKRSDPRPLRFLRAHRYVFDYWLRNGRLPEAFRADGSVRSDAENIAAFGAYMPAFALLNPASARRFYERELLGGYERMGRTGLWGDPQDYYAQNWVWFGVALWSGVATER